MKLSLPRVCCRLRACSTTAVYGQTFSHHSCANLMAFSSQMVIICNNICLCESPIAPHLNLPANHRLVMLSMTIINRSGLLKFACKL